MGGYRGLVIVILVSGKYQVRISNLLCVAEASSFGHTQPIVDPKLYLTPLLCLRTAFFNTYPPLPSLKKLVYRNFVCLSSSDNTQKD